MAIIESLHLASGGGIVSSSKQCRQRSNVANVFIGIGGAGIDALRTIKQRVNDSVIPDNAVAYDDPTSRVSVREYSHIKFLGIDTDEHYLHELIGLNIKVQFFCTDYNILL